LRIDYLPLATENIQDIKRHFLDEGGKTLALKMIRLIRADIALLSEYPNKAPGYELMPGVRRLVVANGLYLVFYRLFAIQGWNCVLSGCAETKSSWLKIGREAQSIENACWLNTVPERQQFGHSGLS
jgi:plasmid stabilization system protein ParE